MWLNRLALAATVGFATVGVIDVGAGRAAELPGKAPPPKVVTTYSWTGCYVGAYVGWAAQNQWAATDLDGLAPAGVSQWDFSPGNEGIGGGTAGCNWQANNWLVLGIEGEGGFLHVEGSGPQPLIVVPPGGGFGSVSDTSRIGTGYGLVGGRVGVAFDRLLLYTKFGVAFFDSAATPSSELVIQPDLGDVSRRGVLPPAEGATARVEGGSTFDKHVLKFPRPMIENGVFASAPDGERALKFAAGGKKAGVVCVSDRCLSTRPAPPARWCGCKAAAHEASISSATRRMGIGIITFVAALRQSEMTSAFRA
jgi:hypothetical protein